MLKEEQKKKKKKSKQQKYKPLKHTYFSQLTYKKGMEKMRTT